jgi:threonylcarbamoyladenosine tRNA methylthiotransferase MtaB
MRIAFTTFGCKINQYDTDAMREAVAGGGNTIVPFDGDADVYVINTCSVTGKSDYQCRQAIRSAARRKEGARIIVTGCYAETRPGEVRSIPGVTHVLGNHGKPDIARYCTAPDHAPSSPEVRHEDHPGTRTRAVLKVQDGCDSRCAYCVVPLARGGSRSVAFETVRESFGRHIAGAVPEVVVSGIHVGRYGQDLSPPTSLGALLHELVRSSGNTRIRLSSIEPGEVSEEILSLLGRGLCRHLHIPLQSGDDGVLRAMNRRYSVADYRRLVESLARQVPGIAIGADVMVGFPGEDERAFANTIQLVSELPITHLHVFSYSPRPGTPAALMDNQVPANEKKIRNEMLRMLGIKKNLEFRRGQVGKRLSVILEEWTPVTGAKGLSDNYIRITIPDAGSGQKGKIIETIVKEASENDTIGDIHITY